MRSLLTASLPLLLALPACGSSNSSKDVVDDASARTELQGTWTDACHAPNRLADVLKTGFAQDRYEFGLLQNRFTRTLSVYSDAACSKPGFTETIEGGYTVIGDGPDIDGGRPINYTLTKATINPQTAAAVDALNVVSYCGVKDWALNQAKEVTNKTCALQQFKNGDVVFDIFRVENKQLTMGKTSFFADGSSGQARPTERNKDLAFTKK